MNSQRACPIEMQSANSKQNKAKWFAKQLASLVYQYKAQVLEFPSKKSDAFCETIQNYSKSPVCSDEEKLAKIILCPRFVTGPGLL